jgi:hypothetical protein
MAKNMTKEKIQQKGGEKKFCGEKVRPVKEENDACMCMKGIGLRLPTSPSPFYFPGRFLGIKPDDLAESAAFMLLPTSS